MKHYKWKGSFILLMLVVLCLIKGGFVNAQQTAIRVDGDSLCSLIRLYDGKMVITQGKVAHICGVDGRKMMLMTAGGETLQVVPLQESDPFQDTLYKHQIRVSGIVTESRVENDQINQMEKEKTLLCPIDHVSCKDSVWIENMRHSGKADAIIEKDMQALREEMEKSGQSYISVITIVAGEIEIID